MKRLWGVGSYPPPWQAGCAPSSPETPQPSSAPARKLSPGFQVWYSLLGCMCHEGQTVALSFPLGQGKGMEGKGHPGSYHLTG